MKKGQEESYLKISRANGHRCGDFSLSPSLSLSLSLSLPPSFRMTDHFKKVIMKDVDVLKFNSTA